MTRQQVIELKAKYRPRTEYPPQCCASCEYLTDSGKCGRYDEVVPAEFMEEVNDCGGYCPRVPF